MLKYNPDQIKKLQKSGELAQIKEKEEDSTTIMFEGDVIAKEQNEISIDDDFISNI
jgi:hypothetical protein